MKRAAFIILILTALACQEDYYPPGLYGYQVEHLLTGGDTGVWYLSEYQVGGERQPISSCEESLQLHFIEAGDSIAVYEITSCQPPDTVDYGSMSASSAAGSATNEHLFTDSLLFEYGTVNYLIVREISSSRFQFDRFAAQGRHRFTYTSD